MMNQSSELSKEVISPSITPSEQASQLTIEQEQEMRLKMKYPNPLKPGGSAFVQKMLNKNSKKYFDSGDYMMAKSKKQNVLNKGGVVQPASNLPSDNTESTPVAQRSDGGMATTLNNSDQSMSQSDMNTPCNASNLSESSAYITPEVSTILGNSSLNSPALELTKNLSTPNNKPTMSSFDANNSNLLNTSNPNSTSPLSASNHLSVNSHYLNPMVHSSQSSQSISVLSSSISSDKIAQIQLNQQQPSLLDSEGIGHGIPTPECLPQSRKHSIVQSKLATPRLSSS